MELLISVDRTSTQPLQQQLYTAFRHMILTRVLVPGQRLPSTRSVASQLRVGRITVFLAYERLAAEGYVSPRSKVGVFVAAQLPDNAMELGSPSAARTSKTIRNRAEAGPTFTGRGPVLWRDPSARPELDLSVGGPHLKSFPYRFWRRSIIRHLDDAPHTQAAYGDPAGLARLRAVIAELLRVTRGIEADAQQVLVTAGIQGALSVLARVFLGGRSPSSVAIENPCYQGAAYLFRSHGARLFPVEVDDQGLIVTQLKRFAGDLVYVTPSHQYPTGHTMSLDRRLQLIDWAQRTGSYLIEDDYDGDFRYDGPPLRAIAGLDRRGRSIYLGTFSRSVGSAIRLGYLVLPPHLVEKARLVKTLLDHGAPWLEQAVLADFLAEGGFLRHLRAIRREHMVARDALVGAIEREFPGSVLSGQACGMHVMWTLPSNLPCAEDVHRLALKEGVGVYPLRMAAAVEYGRQARLGERSLVLGYTALDPSQLIEAISRIARALGKASLRPPRIKLQRLSQEAA